MNLEGGARRQKGRPAIEVSRGVGIAVATQRPTVLMPFSAPVSPLPTASLGSTGPGTIHAADAIRRSLRALIPGKE